MEISSSVDFLALYANFLKVQGGCDVVFDVLENQFFNALHQNGGDCHREGGSN